MRRTALAVLALLLGGCAALERPESGSARTIRAAREAVSSCASVSWPVPQQARERGDSQEARAHASPTEAAAVAGLRFSPKSIRTAEAIGALPELARLHELAGAGDDERILLHRLAARQKVLERISLASLEVSAVLAELDCEGERTDQLRDRLQHREDSRLRRLALGGIVVGAVTALAGGALSLAGHGRAADIAQILGGGAESGIGLSTLSEPAPASLAHPRNPLAAVWSGDISGGALPPSVWNHLGQPVGDVPDGPTHRQVLVLQWRSAGLLDASGADGATRRLALLTGQGGDYTLADLHLRDAMLDLLEARVALFHQDLAALLREVLASETGNR